MTSDADAARWREILFYQTYCQLRLESERLYIGYLWWILEVLLEMGLLWLVFRSTLGSNIEHYLAFLLTGLVAWRWFAQSVLRAAPAILQNQPLAMQVFVPKLLFPSAMLLADAAKFGVGLALLFGFLLYDGFRPSLAWLAFPLVLATQFLLQTAIALWAAALVPFFRSILVGLEVAMRFGMLASGVFFDLRQILGHGGLGSGFASLLAANPMALVIDAWRAVLLEQRLPDVLPLALLAGLSLVGIAAARAFVSGRELVYPRLPA